MIWEEVLGGMRIHIVQRSDRRMSHVVCPATEACDICRGGLPSSSCKVFHALGGPSCPSNGMQADVRTNHCQFPILISIQIHRINPPPVHPQHLRIQQYLVPHLPPPYNPLRILGRHPRRRTQLGLPGPLAPQQRPRQIRLLRRWPAAVARDVLCRDAHAGPAVIHAPAQRELVLRAGREAACVFGTVEGIEVEAEVEVAVAETALLRQGD